MLNAIFNFFAEFFGTVIFDRLLNRDKDANRKAKKRDAVKRDS